MNQLQIECAFELIQDYYGEDYCMTIEQIIELMQIEFEVEISRSQAAILLNPELMDNYINLKHCCYL